MPDELTTTSFSLRSARAVHPEDAYKKVAESSLAEREYAQTEASTLRTLGTPIVDLLGPIPYVDLQQLVDQFGKQALNYFTSPLDRCRRLSEPRCISELADLPVQLSPHPSPW
jgi:hypothetical protein